MKKVLHVGITAPTYSSEAITESFKEVFGDVMYFDWQSHRYNYGTDVMRKNIIESADSFKPDLIFIHANHNSEALSFEVYKSLSAIARTITYTEDVRHDILFFTRLSEFVDHCIFTNRDDVSNLNKVGVKNAVYLPVSYNNLWYKPQVKTEKVYGDIVFIGNNYVGTSLDFPNAPERQEMVVALKSAFGNSFMAYGTGQENPMLNPQQCIEAYNNAKLAITHNNFKRKGYQSDRGLNSMGCGCATILHHYDGIELDFRNMIGGIWKSVDELVSLCGTYIENEWMRKQLSQYQYREVSLNHKWVNRAKKIREILGW